MQTVTRSWRWLCLFVLLAGTAGTAQAQRTVTLTLNTATVPDTIRTDSFIEVRGAVKGVAPFTLADGNVISWDAASTLEPENIGGDYWRIQFQIEDTTELTFKFFSQQAEDDGVNGWEADPNPVIPPGTGDTTLTVHYFESQAQYRGVSGNRGEYDWRPFESKEDSVAVWFRVAMFGPEANEDKYSATGTQTIGVRGDDLGGAGPFGWGDGQTLKLTRESTNGASPAYRIYSGVGYYPASLAGTTQAFKYVIQNGDAVIGWEEGNVPSSNRNFTIPASDTTLQWVYYGDTPPTAVEPVQGAVIFAVDLTPLQQIGVFDVARGDTLEVRGDFNGWDCVGEGSPDDCLLLDVPGEPTFEQVIAITAIPGTERNYKFYLNINDVAFKEQFGVDVVPSGWEEPISTTGSNRTFVYNGNANDFQDLGVQFFNDVLPGNIIPSGSNVDVSFAVDMTAALTNDSRPFEPAAGDSVWIEINDPIWLFTQGEPLPDGGGSKILRNFVLTDDDGNGIYEGTLTVNGPTYGALQYKFAYGQGNDTFIEPGGDTSTRGRRRTRFVPINADGSFPGQVTFPQETFQPTAGALPFEENPATTVGVEEVSGDVPARITLEQNYPNPFNPTTTFEYSITGTQPVTLRVYDLLGRNVATLVDGVQPAGTYRVTFDAAHLASGMYLYRLETPTKVVSKQMVLLK